MLKNTNSSYGIIAKTLHWTVALLIITLLGVGLYMVSLPNGGDKWYFYDLHKATGTVVLVLVLFRVYWRRTNEVPGLPKDMPAWQQIAARWTHYALLTLMVVFPVSGLLMSLMTGHPVNFYGLFTIPAMAEEPGLVAGVSYLLHTYLPYVFISIISLHVLAALYHHFFRKDNILRRMLPWG